MVRWHVRGGLRPIGVGGLLAHLTMSAGALTFIWQARRLRSQLVVLHVFAGEVFFDVFVFADEVFDFIGEVV